MGTFAIDNIGGDTPHSDLMIEMASIIRAGGAAAKVADIPHAHVRAREAGMSEATHTARAVEMLLGAGFAVGYRSRSGHSYYLFWPGRDGTLRVSDHPVTKTAWCHSPPTADLVLNANNAPATEDRLRSVVGRALLQFLLGSTRGGAV